MKYKVRITAVFLSLLLLVTYFPGAFLVNAQTQVIYANDFSKADSHIVKEEESLNEYEISDGVFSLSRKDGSNKNFPDAVRFYINEDKSPNKEGKISVEFKVKRSASKKMSYDFCDENSVLITSIHFQTNSDVSVYYKPSKDGNAKDKVVFNSAPVDEFIDVKVIMNQALKTVEVYLDNMSTAVCSGYYAGEAEYFTYTRLYMRADNYHTVTMDDLSYSKVERSDAETIEMDHRTLTYESFGTELPNMVTDTIVLPATGQYGSEITWKSETESAIEIVDGKALITRGSEDTVASFTATLKKGTEERTKSFEITILKKSASALPTAQNGYLINNSMNGINHEQRISILDGSPSLTKTGTVLHTNDALAYYLNLDTTGTKKTIAYNLDLKGSGTIIDFYDYEEEICYTISTENDSLTAIVRSENAGEMRTDEPYEKLLKKGLFDREITIVMDPVSGLFTLWYGSDLLADSMWGKVTPSNISRVEFKQASGETTIASIKAFYPTLPDENAVLMDYVALKSSDLTWQNEDKITSDLRLPVSGCNGSTIIWESSDENVITKDGKVITPVVDTPVTMTAIFAIGEAKKNKEFSFVVLSEEKDELPIVKKLISEDYFDKNVSTGKWSFDAQGGSISIKDGKLSLTRLQSEGAVTEAFFGFDGRGTFFKGVYGLEFTVKNQDKTLAMRVRGRADYAAVGINSTGLVSVINGFDKTNNGENNSSTRVGTYTDTIKFTFLFNTLQDDFSLWINDKQVISKEKARYTNHQNLKNIRFYLEKANMQTVELDNFRFYEAYPLSADRVEMDNEWLTTDKFVDENDPASAFGCVSKDLLLPYLGCYGSDITWTSSDEKVISNDGVITQSEKEHEVIMTARISAGSITKEIPFTLRVPAQVTDDDDAVSQDIASITEDKLSYLDDPSDGIIRSVSLPAIGMYGSTITWDSDKKNYISNSGRLTRPRYDENDEVVTLTATVTRGSVTKTKKLSFTVLKDKPFVDPDYMSDEDFFGKWNNKLSAWDIEGKWDYSHPGMEKLEKAVKEADGDYTKAEDELLNYFINIRENSGSISLSNKNTGWANMIADGFLHLQRSAYYKEACRLAMIGVLIPPL